MERDSIYRLLGLPGDSDIEHLRAAYEGAIAAATARGDWTRAGQLSAAFDVLPPSVRLAVYGGRGRNADRSASAGRGTPRLTAARARPRRSLGRILLAGVAVVVAALAVGARLSDHAATSRQVLAAPKPATSANVAMPMPTPSHRRAAATPAAPTWSPMRSVYPGSGEVLVPTSALRGADGLAEVMCPDNTGASWYVIKTRPGELFICPSGFVGRVRMPATS